MPRLCLSYSWNYVACDPYAVNKTLIKYPQLCLVLCVRKLHSLSQQTGGSKPTPAKTGVADAILSQCHSGWKGSEGKTSPSALWFTIHPNRRGTSRVGITPARSHTAFRVYKGGGGVLTWWVPWWPRLGEGAGAKATRGSLLYVRYA